MKVKCLLIGIAVLFVAGALADSSYAKLDPKTCVGILLFDEDKGDTTIDSSGNDRDGLLKNSPKWVNGKFGMALEFNGTNTYVEVPYPDEFTLEIFSVMAWIKTSETSAWSGIVEKREPGQVANYALEMTSSNTVQFIFTKGGDQKWQIATTKTVVTDGNWHHIVGTYDNESLRIYTDGILENQTAFTGAPDKNIQPLTIGSQHSGAGRFNGLIDEVAIFNEALGENTIQTIMNQGLEKATGASAVDANAKLTFTWGATKVQ